MLVQTLRAIAFAAALTLILTPRVLAQGAQAASSLQTGDPGNAASDRAPYTQIGCGTCHGVEGRSTAVGPSIATGELTLPDFIAYVRRPTGSMPAYSAQVVSDQVLADIHAYLKSSVATLAPAGRVDVGATLYRRTGCYACHANEGQGGTQGPRIGPDPGTFARFSWYVRNPSGNMPPYTDTVMSDQDLTDIHAFLQARPPAVSPILLLAP